MYFIHTHFFLYIYIEGDPQSTQSICPYTGRFVFKGMVLGTWGHGIHFETLFQIQDEQFEALVFLLFPVWDSWSSQFGGPRYELV